MPARDEIHVWRADLGPSGVRRARADAILRELLAGYQGVETGAVSTRRRPGGKPEATWGDVCFNLSHSGRVGLFAFARGVEVGVDVELLGRGRDRRAAVRRALGADHARRLEALDGAERERELLRAWTRHEAALKCSGAGLGGIPPRVWVVNVEAGPGAIGALAATREPLDVVLCGDAETGSGDAAAGRSTWPRAGSGCSSR